MLKAQFQLFQVQSFVCVLAVVLSIGADRAGQSRVYFWLQLRSVSLLGKKPIYSLK